MMTVRGFIAGRVQGVGFRYFVAQQAQQKKLTGYAVNLADGRVEFLLQGAAESVESALHQLASGPRYARVESLNWKELDGEPERSGFITR